MKKIIVISDSHGAKQNLRMLLDKESYDLICYLGDGIKDLSGFDLEEKLYAVAGNCDLFSTEPLQLKLVVENIPVLLTHGHKYNVKSGLWTLAKEAREQNIKLVLFGHTHKSIIENFDDVKLINPGSLFSGNYILLTINKGTILKIEQKNLY